MKNWRIVDVDHYMKGNSFFNKMVTEEVWHQGVEQSLGTPEKRIKEIKEADEVKDARKLIDIYSNYINLKEPRSNRGLEDFKTKDQMDAIKKEAQAQALLKQQETKLVEGAEAEVVEGETAEKPQKASK